MKELDYVWHLTSSGPGTGIEGTGFETDVSIWINSSASTTTVDIQSALSSAGPWATEQSTQMASNTATVIRLAGPVAWIQPYVNGSTAARVRILGVSGGW